MIRFTALGTHLRKRFNQLPKMRCAAPRQEPLPDSLPIGKQSNTVAGKERQLRQRDRGSARIVEFRVHTGARLGDRQCSAPRRNRSNTRTHQPATIEHDPYRLAALGLVLAGNGTAASRSCSPADVAQVVALTILTQALEVAAQPALTGLAQLQINLPAACEKDLLFFSSSQRRINADLLHQRRLRPALSQT